MKALAISLGLILSAGCNRAYLVGFDALSRISQVSEQDLEKTSLIATPDPPKATSNRPGVGVSVVASRLDFEKGRWLDSVRMRVPAKRPIGALLGSATVLGIGIALVVGTGVVGANRSCEQASTAYYSAYNSLNCLPRNLGSIALGSLAATVGGIGIYLTYHAGVALSPEYEASK